MKTNQIAKLANVHPNTVHLYEKWGYISPVPRQANGYRQYTLVHALQMKVARLAFRQEFIQNNLRKMATVIVVEVGKEQFEQALTLAKAYLKFLYSELHYTHQAVELVNDLIKQPTGNVEQVYTHKEIAEQLQLTEETLRNWERNGLYAVKRTSQNRRIYNENDRKKLLVIRTLRSAHFSLTSIRQLLVDTHHIHTVDDIINALNITIFKQQFLHVTDALHINLNNAIADIESAIALLEHYISGDLSLASINIIN